MSYTDDQVRTKLNTLADTQDSIEQVGNWALFHRRHAPRTATIWAQYLKDAPPSKRLNLIYLANEVVQQSRIKKKEDFPDAFTPLIADSLATAYNSATREVQGKLRRVVQVWRDRNIFDTATTDNIDAKLAEIDKARGPQRRALGGSLFGASSSNPSSSSSIPPELAKLADAQTASSKAAAAVPDEAQLARESASLSDSPDAAALPAHSAQLSKLLKQLDTAAAAVEASIAARATLTTQLQALLADNSAQTDRDAARAASLASRRQDLAARKAAAEDAIMRAGGHPEPPEIEALTPPDMESFTPPPEEAPAHAAQSTPQTQTQTDADGARTPPGEPSPFARSLVGRPGEGEGSNAAEAGEAGKPAAGAVVEDAFAGAASRDPRRRGPPAAKRRRVAVPEEEAQFTGDVMEGLDADVVGMLS